jgi:hypothetical protein
MRRVKITKLPSKQRGGQGTASNGYNNSVPEQLSNFGGADVRGAMDNPDISTRRTLKSVPRTEANVEAEKGEVAYGDINGDKFAELYVIGGKRHANGGTPLNLPEGTYIFSDFRDMKIKDPRILAMFEKINNKGKSKKAGGYTPAELAKSYDINKFRGILQDPNSDKNDIMTAELMIKNYQMKLGALALAAESKKNFEQGIPEVSRPYMEKMGIRDEDILPAEQLQHEQSETAQYEQMEGPESQEDMMQQPMAQKGGFLPAYQTQGQVNNPYYYSGFESAYENAEDSASYRRGFDSNINDTYFSATGTPLGRSVKSLYDPFERGMDDGEQLAYERLQAKRSPIKGDGYYTYGKENRLYKKEGDNWLINTQEGSDQFTPLSKGDVKKRTETLNKGANFYAPVDTYNKHREAVRPKMSNGGQHQMPDGSWMPGITHENYMTMAQDGYQIPFDPGMTIPQYGGSKNYGNQNWFDTNQDSNAMNYTFGNPYKPIEIGDPTKRGFVNSAILAIKQNKKNRQLDNNPYERIPLGAFKMKGQDKFSFQDGGQLKKYQNGDEVSNTREILPEEMTADELANTFAGNKDVANLYIDINSAFSDPTFRRIFVEQTKAALKEKERYQGKSGGQGKTWEDQFGAGSVDKLDPEEIIKSFVNHQKRNLALQAQGVDPRLYSDSNGTLMTSAQVQNLTYPGTSRKYTKEEAEAKVKQLKDKGYTTLNKTFSILKLPLGDARQSRLEQATFHGYNRMLDHKGDYTKEEQALLEPWASDLQSGTADEPGETGERKRISPIDSVYTNTTAGHLVGRAVKKPDETVDETVTDTEDEVYNPGLTDIQGAVDPNDAPWWLQDSINIAGSVMDKSKIKDLYPWAPTPDLEEVQLMKTDPTRELAALSERYGTAANAMASMMPGQSYAANLRGMSGAGDIANTLARYNNQNVQIDNQEQLTNNSIRNQENTMRQGVAKQLYDDTMKTMANAQMQDLAFDREARGLLTQGITNKEQTNALNQMYPQYAVDPSIGGRMHFTQGKESLDPSKDKTFDWWFQQYKEQGMADKDAINAAKISSGQSSFTNGYAGPDMEAIMAQYAQLGGFISGYNTYPFEY